MRAIIVSIVGFLLLSSPVQAQSFTTIAGIELGSEMQQYWSLVHDDTATELPDVLFLKEVKLKSDAIPGVRGGSLGYSTCSGEKRVVRMKLKFVDRSERLFKDLDQLYRKRLGKPDQWMGNAFKTVQAWQWLLGAESERIEVILMHSKLDDMRPGVSIKMTLLSLWEQEQECWEQQNVFGMKAPDTVSAPIGQLDDFVPH